MKKIEEKRRRFCRSAVSHHLLASNGKSCLTHDRIVLMSDCFPKMFNETGEMPGDAVVNKVFRESANLKPHEIINRFVKVGEE